jgi:integrase
VASAWVQRRELAGGVVSWRVLYRLGGRETKQRVGGTFRRQRDANSRRDWIAGEIANMRVPNLELVGGEPTPTLRHVADLWRASRVDVSEGTRLTYETNLERVLPTLGDLAVAEIAPADVAGVVSDLSGRGLKRESIRKTLSTLAQVLDFAKVVPNPVRDRDVRLPASEAEEVHPPTAAHVEAALGALPRQYRLPVLVLDATGMRVGELEALRWGDVDEPERRFRVSRATAKTRKGRWVPVPQKLLQAVLDTVPREDRDVGGQVFAGFDADALRTSLGRGCKAAGVPTFSPHDLRHRRASLWHLSGVPVVEACDKLGHSPQVHLGLYAHVVLDRRELDYGALLSRPDGVTSVLPSAGK